MQKPIDAKWVLSGIEGAEYCNYCRHKGSGCEYECKERGWNEIAIHAMILAAPEVNMVKHGYWNKVQDSVDDNGNAQYMCSNCFHGDFHAESVDVPYCWYCGARMAEEE